VDPLLCAIDQFDSGQTALNFATDVASARVSASLVGRLIPGNVGAAVAASCHVDPRRKLNAQRW
jgi:fructose-specific phosphotransferase system IIC component